jgi:hypothetical protein
MTPEQIEQEHLAFAKWVEDRAEGTLIPSYGRVWLACAESKQSELDALKAHIADLEKDAARYQWLRERLATRESQSVSGSWRLAIEIRIGRSFFDTPSRGAGGYLIPSKFWEECDLLDAAIDKAMEKP